MRKNSTIDCKLDNMSPEDFGKMMVVEFQDVEKGDSRLAKEVFGEYKKLGIGIIELLNGKASMNSSYRSTPFPASISLRNIS
ncbi:hypothetical protein A9Q68_09580 [Streptococcus bovimastitidis]|uniref:Uncharacterized protein n=1 Tax=Streptococcus bovimastitidis TaxID=1856638 RepID=A0A1L8ML28_9STRE|nr:hypothetical protein [Streptococcus bovimastitidis]OJF71421.1 hypothetical protein A9Q68_09580 [Streptococcus bovimastitidis]